MSSLKFGTSGLRGLVVDLEGASARRWCAAFLTHLEGRPDALSRTLLVGRDLRASSPTIARDCTMAAGALGWRVVDCGALPTPALAAEALRRGAAAVMVTGSHIPDDRNGLKFYAPGEITKADEEAIRLAQESLGPGDFEGPVSAEDGAETSLAAFRARYLGAFAADALAGLRIGVYQQSTVARDLLVELLQALGAEVEPLGRAARFVPVDTEAHRPEDLALLAQWAAGGRFDAIVSADGDADRPLVSDAAGAVLRGDELGLLAAAFLGAGTVVTPVTSSGAVEASGVAERVRRTRVGSPFVIEGMDAEIAAGARSVLGFEANGGVLLGSPVALARGTLASLPTRDAVLPILCALAGARARGVSVRALAQSLGAGHALADRLKNVPQDASAPFLARLAGEEAEAAALLAPVGAVRSRDRLDGVRFVLADGAILHFRASGNAPELRVYVEAGEERRAREILAWGLAFAERQTTE